MDEKKNATFVPAELISTASEKLSEEIKKEISEAKDPEDIEKAIAKLTEQNENTK